MCKWRDVLAAGIAENRSHRKGPHPVIRRLLVALAFNLPARIPVPVIRTAEDHALIVGLVWNSIHGIMRSPVTVAGKQLHLRSVNAGHNSICRGLPCLRQA